MTVKTSRQARFARLRAQARSAARRAGGGGGGRAGGRSEFVEFMCSKKT